jgi:hypothetical protein
MRRVAGLMPCIGGLGASVATHKTQQPFTIEKELFARIIRSRMNSGIHADGITGTGFYTKPTEYAAELVNHKANRIPFVSPPAIAFWVFTRFNVDTLRRASRGTTKASHAARGTVLTLRKPVHPPKSFRVRAPLFRVADRVNALIERFEYRIWTLTECPLFGVVQKMSGRQD